MAPECKEMFVESFLDYKNNLGFDENLPADNQHIDDDVEEEVDEDLDDLTEEDE